MDFDFFLQYEDRDQAADCCGVEDNKVAHSPLGERTVELASPQLSNGPSQAANQTESKNSESPIQVIELNQSAESPEIENQNRDSQCTDERNARKPRLNTNASNGARKAKKRRRQEAFPIDGEYFPSEDERRKRTREKDTRHKDILDYQNTPQNSPQNCPQNCLRVQSVHLIINRESRHFR
jgi:hypothetical protein